MTLGAFLIGMLLSASDYRYQIEATIAPFKDTLMSLFFIAVGMVASACVRAQVSAAVVAFVILLTLTIVGHPAILPSSAVDWFSKSLRYISWDAHFRTFWEGKIDTRDILYFLFTNVFCVFLTTVVVTVRRWR